MSDDFENMIRENIHAVEAFVQTITDEAGNEVVRVTCMPTEYEIYKIEIVDKNKNSITVNVKTAAGILACITDAFDWISEQELIPGENDDASGGEIDLSTL